jgi:dienelactone hydrolase
MYGNGKQAEHPDDAAKFSAEVNKNMPVARERFEAGMDVLKRDPTVDASKIAAIGYCFGGGIVLNMAREGVDLKGVASFHGMLGTKEPAKPGEIKARIISFTGEKDPMIPASSVAAFRKEMDDAGADYRVITYPNAEHAFTNPEADELGKKFHLPLAYDPQADKDSWRQATVFLQDVFAGK